MKLAIVYDPTCPKLTQNAYSQTYRDMFCALIDRFDEVEHITDSKEVKADVVIYFDIHSAHEIDVKTSALSYEYFNDPHQKDSTARYPNGTTVKKMGAENRCKRALERNVNFIICPYQNGYYKYLSPHLPDGMLVWFPVSPKLRDDATPLLGREPAVLANGHQWQGEHGFRPYQFRTWAYRQPNIEFKAHCIQKTMTPSGDQYTSFLGQYAGALALCDAYVVPKYLEIPMAGCVCFAQYQFEYEQMGFKDMESCVYVNRSNFHDRINDFLSDPKQYQSIADAGRRLVKSRWTASHFAEFVYAHAKEHL